MSKYGLNSHTLCDVTARHSNKINGNLHRVLLLFSLYLQKRLYISVYNYDTFEIKNFGNKTNIYIKFNGNLYLTIQITRTITAMLYTFSNKTLEIHFCLFLHILDIVKLSSKSP